MTERLTTHFRRLLWLSSVLVFLIAMNYLCLAGGKMKTRELPDLSPGVVATPVRQLGETGIIFFPQSSEAERRILESRLAPDPSRYLLVEYRATWPEFAGIALYGIFAMCCFWFVSSVVSKEWTQQRADYVSEAKLASLAALYLTYGTAAWLGWVWMVNWPYWLMGSSLLFFGKIIRMLPTIEKPYLEPTGYLIVEKAPR